MGAAWGNTGKLSSYKPTAPQGGPWKSGSVSSFSMGSSGSLHVKQRNQSRRMRADLQICGRRKGAPRSAQGWWAGFCACVTC